MATGRKVAWRENTNMEDIGCLLLFNDGNHIYVTDFIKLDGHFDWKWISFAEFSSCPKSLGTLTEYSSAYLRSHGHNGRVAKVTINQLLKKTCGKKNTEFVVKDWKVTFFLFPKNVVLVQTVDDRTVEISRVRIEYTV